MATAQRMTPGVYIEEKNAFPNSVVEVATAIPVFIGYTESAAYKGKSYTNKAVKVTSMVDYNAFFGGAPAYKLSVLADSGTPPATPVISESITLNGADYLIAYDTKSPAYYMYNSIRLFYQNGGGNCYVISIGGYSNAPVYEDLYNGLKILENEFDPTLIVIPDSLMLTSADWQKLAGNMFEHCYKFQNRMSLFDVYDGYISDKTQVDDIITNTRTYLGTNYLNYGATYFPWLVSSVVDTTEISIMNISEPAIDDIFSKLLETDTATAATLAKIKPNVTNAISAYDSAIKANDPVALANAKLSLNAANNALLSASANYTNIILGMQNVLNTLPAAPAMAGIYTAVDNARGVWKAPANVSLNAVIKPTINLNDDQQADLNIDAVTGKSINVIRSFVGQGVLVWGARTLEGNSQDWRYVSVRRTLIMIEQSVKLAARAYVFEPNDANTWASVKSMLENFLNSLWKKGALVGSKADDAYSVSVGLGSTMTGDDILNGYMLITVLVAVSHPAEFIVITFQQQMQKS